MDVTLVCEGLSLKAHKVVLSASSSFFQTLFLENPCKHPIIILKDVSYSDLKAIVEFLYQGEVNVLQAQLGTLLKTAEMLKMKDLLDAVDEGGHRGTASVADNEQAPAACLPASPPPISKVKRKRHRRCSERELEDQAAVPQTHSKVSKSLEVLGDGRLPRKLVTQRVTPIPSNCASSTPQKVTASAPADVEGGASSKLLMSLENNMEPSQENPGISTSIVRPNSDIQDAGYKGLEEPGPSLAVENVGVLNVVLHTFANVMGKTLLFLICRQWHS